MTLREAVVLALRDIGEPARGREIAERIAEQGYYRRRDGTAVPGADVNVTANDTKAIFHVDRGLIGLREWTNPAPHPRTATPVGSPASIDAGAVQQGSTGRSGTLALAPPSLISEEFWGGALDVSGRSGAPDPGPNGLPEIRGAEVLRDSGASDAEVRLWLTFTAAMDRARDADALWASATRLYSTERWTFDPSAVASASFASLADALRNSRVSQRHGPDAAVWRLIAESLADRTTLRGIKAAVWEGVGDATVLRAELQATTASGTPRFPALRGPKIGPMWIRMLAVPGGAAIANMATVPVAVDVQVRRASEHLGVSGAAELPLELARPRVQQAWAAAVASAGAPGPPALRDTPAALDPALWFWGKWGCTRCETLGRRDPIGTACRFCDLPERGESAQPSSG